MNLTLSIAFRYLRSRRQGRYAGLLTATAVLSVAIGMLAFILVMSVMRGFRSELADRLLGFNAHITIARDAGALELSKGDLEQLLSPYKIRDLAPFVQGEVIAQSTAAGELLAQGARVRGVEPGLLGAMNRVDFYFPEDGEGIEALGETHQGKALPSAIVGNEVVTQLSVHPDFGDLIQLTAPLAEVSPGGEVIPNVRRFEVTGVFRAGVYEYDSRYILISIADARRLLGLQGEEGWLVRLEEMSDVSSVLADLKEKLPDGWSAIGWNEQNKKLFAALKLERIAMGGVLLMVLFIASFAIVGVVLLVTAAKRKDIGILESIGMTSRDIARIFLCHAALIGAAGSAIGLVAGLGISYALRIWPIKLPASYYLDWLPVDIDPIAAIGFALTGVVIAIVAAIYPVRQAMKTSPIEVLRYE